MVIPFVVAFCAICGTYACKKVHDIFKKREKTKREKLALKGKSIEQVGEDNKLAQKENDEWKKKYDELDEKMRKRDEEIKTVTDKLKDPNIPKKEREELEEKLAILVSNQENDTKEKKSILDKLKKLDERIKNNNSIISGTVSNLDEKHWIWDLFTMENILLGVGCYVVYKLLKEDNK